MKTRRVLCLLVIGGAACFAQAPTTQTMGMKGHHIGESVTQFLAVENAGDRLTHCHDQLMDAPLVARVNELKQCSLQANPNRHCLKIITDMNLQIAQGQIDECAKLDSAIKGGSVKIGSNVLNMPLPGSASFGNGKLVEMELDFWNLPGNEKSFAGGFDAVLEDFTAKFGSPTKIWADEFQNGFGARFNYRRASWETEAVIILLSELDGHNATSIIRDRAFFAKAAKEEAEQHHNVLDR